MVPPRDARKSEIPQFKVSVESRFSALRENLSILLAPVRLATHPGANQPFESGSLWRRPEEFGRAQWMSLATHGLLIFALAMPLAQNLTQTRTGTTGRDGWQRLAYSGFPPPKPLMKKQDPRGGGGGGDRNTTPASVGLLVRIARQQIVPPTLNRNAHPNLPVEATVVALQELSVPKLSVTNIGDPFALSVTSSLGPGTRGGAGKGNRGGIGPGDGPGIGPGNNGNFGGEGIPRAGTLGTTYPECSYCPLPDYSDDARKAKLQGPVEIRLVVTADGRATNLQVVRGLGLGLDERAIEAVRKWHFRPSRDAAGRPTAAWVTVEVTFRLL